MGKTYSVAYTRNENPDFIAQFATKWDEQLGENKAHEKMGIFMEPEGIKKYNRLVEKIKKGKLKFMVLSALSDIHPETKEAINELQLLRSYGCSFYVENENLILETQQDIKLLKPINRKKENSKDRYTVPGKNGSFNESQIAFGYNLIDGKPQINIAEAEVIRKVYKMYLDGLGCKLIGERLIADGDKTKNGSVNWYPKTVCNIINNEKYMTPIGCGGEYDPIISESMFLEAQKLKSAQIRRHGKLAKKRENILVGKVFCGNCNAPYRRVRRKSPYTGKGIYRWTCGNKFTNGVGVCTNNNIEDLYLKKLLKEAFNEYAITRCARIDVETAAARLTQMEKGLHELEALHARGYLDEKAYNEEITEKKTEIEKNRKLIEASPFKVHGFTAEDKSTSDINRMVDFLCKITIHKNWTITFTFDGDMEVKKRFTNNKKLR